MKIRTRSFWGKPAGNRSDCIDCYRWLFSLHRALVRFSTLPAAGCLPVAARIHAQGPQAWIPKFFSNHST
jgi:hypothetical protein